MNRYVKGLAVWLVMITPALSIHAAEIDGWIERLNSHCSITPESTPGKDIPSMLFEIKEHVFDAAELRAKEIAQHIGTTDAEKRCAETVLGALPTLKASVQGAATAEPSEVQEPRGVSADGKHEELKRLDAERRLAETKGNNGGQQSTALSPVLEASSVTTKTDGLHPENSSWRGMQSSDWLQLLQEKWELLLAFYVVALTTVAWLDRRRFDKPWKVVASKTALYMLSLPLIIGWLVLKLLWFGLKREALGGSTSPASSKPAHSSGSLQGSPPATSSDDMVNIEIQDVGGGAWKKITTAPNNPDAIRNAFRNVGQSPSVRKVRAIGTRTGQLYDMR